jgi:hypothetical protein
VASTASDWPLRASGIPARQRGRHRRRSPRLSWADRAILAALTRRLSASRRGQLALRSAVQPASFSVPCAKNLAPSAFGASFFLVRHPPLAFFAAFAPEPAVNVP